jgi:uncharacterized protein YdiU (UPF0061 family)
MSTTKSKKAEATDAVKDAFEKYFNSLAEDNDKVTDGIAKMRESNARIIDKLLETVEKGQSDLLELNRAIASNPADYAANMKLAMDTMTNRQACALDLGKTVYQEQSALNAAYVERMQAMFSPLNSAEVDWMAPYKKMTEFWTAGIK